MDTLTIPTEPPEPPRSLLFPDLAPEDFVEAQRLAAALAVPTMPCDADDVLLAMHLIGVAKHMLANGFKSQAFARLADDTSIAAQRANVALAKMLRRFCGDDPAITLPAALDLVKTLAVVLSVAAPDKRKPKHPGG